MTNKSNHRILAVDDQPEVLEDFKKILVSPRKKNNDREKKLTSLETKLFWDADTGDSVETELFWDADTGDCVSGLSEEGYTVVTANQGEEAISLVKEAMAEKKPFAVVFMDVKMPPGINGVEAASEIRMIDPDIEIVFVTAYSDVSRQEMLKLLGTGDKMLYLRKPFDTDELKQLALSLTEKWNLNKAIVKKTEELKLTHAIAIRTLAELAELRDSDTGSHLKRVSEYSKFIARELSKLEDPKWCRYITPGYVEDIGQSSVLHDIGKVGIPDSILLKQGKLSAAEFELMKSHSAIGGDALTKADKELGIRSFLTLGKEIAYHHHEKFDGTGYPKRLKGEGIPLSARIVALADVYDALTSNRPYRESLPHEIAAGIITGEMGKKHFDPVILEIFIKNEAEFQKIHNQCP